MQNVNFRMACTKATALDQFCLKRNWVRSDIIRVAIEEFLARYENASFHEAPRVTRPAPVQTDFQFIDGT